MPEPTALRLSATVLDAPDPGALAAYYRELLGWEVLLEEPEWVVLGPSGAGAGLSFQREADHVAPTWPQDGDGQQMQLHLDVAVAVAVAVVDDDPAGSLVVAADRAVVLGGRLAGHQPQDHVRVVLDPVGHPFCLFLPDS